jgi:hypothetical protein
MDRLGILSWRAIRGLSLSCVRPRKRLPKAGAFIARLVGVAIRSAQLAGPEALSNSLLSRKQVTPSAWPNLRCPFAMLSVVNAFPFVSEIHWPFGRSVLLP